MINSDLIQTLVIDRPNLKMNNREKIIGGDLLWRFPEAAKNQIFERFMDKSCLHQLEALVSSFNFY